MKANITLEQAKERAPKWLWRKMEHTIELLQKAERLALTYDKEDGFYLAFSAGKDSQALFHMAELAGVKFKGHVNWTSVDPPQVIRFKRKYYPEVVEHKPKKSIYDLAIDRGILPSMRIRWCCADLKESAGAGKVTLIGIRAEESTRRAKRHEVEVSDKRFSGNLDEFEQWRKAEIAKREERLIKKMKREGKKVNEDEFSLQSDNEVRCINGKDSILVSPIFNWTERDVWTFLNEVVRVPHCDLYDQGYKRIGCILCPMSQHRQKVRELKDFPHVKRGWIRAIKEIRRGGGIQKRIYIVEHPEQRNSQECQRKAPQLATTPLTVWEIIKKHRNGYTMGIGRTAMQFIGSEADTAGSSTTTNLPPPTKEEKIWQHSQRPSMEMGRRKNYPPRHDRRKLWKNKELPKHPAIKDWVERVLQYNQSKMPEFRQKNVTEYERVEQTMQQRTMGGFLDNPSLNGDRGGQNQEPTEDEIAEKIFLWWTSGKAYSKWYADEYLQMKLDFDEEVDE